MEKKSSETFRRLIMTVLGIVFWSGLILFAAFFILDRPLLVWEIALAIAIPTALAGITFILRLYLSTKRRLRQAHSSIEEISKSKGVEKLVLAKEEAAKLEIDRNRQRRYRLSSLSVEEFMMFRQTRWELSPGINVLLGKNGYGKSLLFRTIVGMLWNDSCTRFNRSIFTMSFSVVIIPSISWPDRGVRS